MAEVNEYRFEQVTNNLLSNAAKFSNEGGVVEVSLEKRDTSICVHVRDYGTGIPKDFKHKIYEQFTQADSSTTRQHGGTGLGLSITKALVDGMGGTITFDSEEGKGTVFTVTLPSSD